MSVHDVFTPDRYPKYTYVERNHGQYEEELKFRLQKPPTIVSLSGPSKSGKSMLLNNVVDKLDYQLCKIHGSNINSVSDLWDNTLDKLDTPNEIEKVEANQEETQKEGGANLGVSFAGANVGGTTRDQRTHRETTKHTRRGLKQIINIVDIENFVLFIDDAHYISREDHSSISEGIKEAYESGLSICLAFIPYRSDDLTRANPDLNGRVFNLSFGYWDLDDLQEIGQKGFRELKRHPPDIMLRSLAKESLGSPHLMQQLCLEICNELNIYEKAEEMNPIEVESEDIENVLAKTAERQDKTTIYQILSGASTNSGNDRNVYLYNPGRTEGDIYDLILRAVSENPPQTTFDQADILDRIETVTFGETPHSGNITQAIKRIDKWTSEYSDEAHVFEWDDERKCLEIPDPYLMFYLRWSDRLGFKPGVR
jgi:hypothetical protein